MSKSPELFQQAQLRDRARETLLSDGSQNLGSGTTQTFLTYSSQAEKSQRIKEI